MRAIHARMSFTRKLLAACAACTACAVTLHLVITNLGTPGGDVAAVAPADPRREMCPIPVQKAATFDDKNFYKSKRTAQEVAWGLRENTRMLNWIQESSKLPIVVMYGSLIGLWWNQQSLPWDTDV